MASLHCYNMGCQKNYKEDENSDEACQHHPGVAVFHDALKGWSCCKKRSPDFTEFLNIPGCSKGFHNPQKPPLSSEKNQQKDDREGSPEPVRAPLPKPEEAAPRPSPDEPMTRLPATVSASLKSALEKQLADVSLDSTANGDCDTTVVKIGESCKNNACTRSYEGEESNFEKCKHHPGQPIFHEGMKYWSCCQRKTTEFDNFLAQEGCTQARHVWHVEKCAEKEVVSRHDWHQTAQHVTLSIFAKVAIPDKTWVEANQVAARIHVTFDKGDSVFFKDLQLYGVIDPAKSNLKLLGPKVEINFRKAEAGSWVALEMKES